MPSRKQDAALADAEAEPAGEPELEQQVDMSDWPRNEFGTLLNPDDGQPVFHTVTGESRQQYLARTFEEDKAALLADLEASIAADSTPPTDTPTETKE